MKGLLARLAVALVATALCLVLVEQTLRATGFEYRPMTIDVANEEDARLYHLFEDNHFVYDPEAIWKPKKSYQIFNAQGFRGPEVSVEEAAGRLRVFTVGDSNTLGWATEEGGNWPHELGELIAKIRPDSEVVNAGVWGYSSYQGVVRLREVLGYRPDLVLVSFGSNDAHRVLHSDRDFARGGLFAGNSLRRLLDYRLGQLAAAAWDRWRGGAAELRPRVSLDEYRDNLREMARLCRESGAEMVLLTRPYVGRVRNATWWKNFGGEYNLATVEVAESEGLLLIDLYSYFKDQDKLFSDESHFTREGHELAASIVLQPLKPRLAARRREARRP